MQKYIQNTYHHVQSYFLKTFNGMGEILNFIHTHMVSISTCTRQSQWSLRPGLTAAPAGDNRNCDPPAGSTQAVKFAGEGLSELIMSTGMSDSVLQGEGAGWGDLGEKAESGKNSGVSEARLAQP